MHLAKNDSTPYKSAHFTIFRQRLPGLLNDIAGRLHTTCFFPGEVVTKWIFSAKKK